jgi:3-oxoacyl-[acyl-carrier protein] reductase
MKPVKPFSESVAIVTGAGQGIGLEIAKTLAKKGVSVVLNDLDATLAEAGAKELEAAGGTCLAFSGDVSQVECIEAMVAKTVERFGCLDLVVANAGITLFGDFLTYPEKDFTAVMELNLRGSFFLAQKAALQMIKQGWGGSILFMSSVVGHQAHKNLGAYAMTKAALEMLAKNLVVELAPYGINTNAIAPGATMTERTAKDPHYEKTWSKITPMGRPATVKDIAETAVFLVSPEARHVSGQSLVVDGGWTAVSLQPE